MVQDKRLTRIRGDKRFRVPSKVECTTELDERYLKLFEDSRFQTTDHDGRVRKPASGVLKSAGNLKLISENSDSTGEKKKNKKTGEKAKVEIDSVPTKRGKRTKTRKNIEHGGGDTTVEQFPGTDYDKKALEGCETDASEGNCDNGNSRTHQPLGDMFYWDNDAHSESSSDYEPLVESELQKELADTAWGNETIPQSEDVSQRLAILGCDWETITAQDLYVLCHTVSLGKPCDLGTAITEEGDKISKNILEAWVYPSKFGKQRMAEVEKRGPVLPSITAEEEEWNPAVSEINHLAVRSFERERSRYFYGVIACATVQIAQCLYDELDSIAAGFALDALDLRFIPDEIQEFEFEPASYANSIPKSYCAPKCICISGLLSSNARLKWDLDDPKEKLVQRIMSEGDLLEMNINEILDSDLSEMEMKPNEARKLLLGDSSDDENYDAYASKAEDNQNFFDIVRDENSFGEEEPDITRSTIDASLKSFEKSRREQREDGTKKPIKKRKSRSFPTIGSQATPAHVEVSDAGGISSDDDDHVRSAKYKKHNRGMEETMFEAALDNLAAAEVAQDDRFKALRDDHRFSLENQLIRDKISKKLKRRKVNFTAA